MASNSTPQNSAADTTSDGYDRHLIPAETAARIEREGDRYKTTPDSDSSSTAEGGYTVDTEGLVNNYAIEPEIYHDVPGDMREENEAADARRSQTLREVNQTDESGKLKPSDDNRGKGPGLL